MKLISASKAIKIPKYFMNTQYIDFTLRQLYNNNVSDN